MSAVAEAAGVPSVSLVCEGFVGQAANTSEGLGMPNLPLAAVDAIADPEFNLRGVQESFWIRRTIAPSQWPDWTRQTATECEAIPGEDLPVIERPEDITVVVTGGDLAIAQHAYFPAWGFPACRIARRIE